jgi:hypothetical protein
VALVGGEGGADEELAEKVAVRRVYFELPNDPHVALSNETNARVLRRDEEACRVGVEDDARDFSAVAVLPAPVAARDDDAALQVVRPYGDLAVLQPRRDVALRTARERRDLVAALDLVLDGARRNVPASQLAVEAAADEVEVVPRAKRHAGHRARVLEAEEARARASRLVQADTPIERCAEQKVTFARPRERDYGLRVVREERERKFVQRRRRRGSVRRVGVRRRPLVHRHNACATCAAADREQVPAAVPRHRPHRARRRWRRRRGRTRRSRRHGLVQRRLHQKRRRRKRRRLHGAMRDERLALHI